MSSFVIDKKEFIKAAGLMRGFEEAKRDPHKWFVDNVRQQFEHAYALNVASVCEQYDDGEVVPDEESHDELFEAYRKKGALIRTEGYTTTNGIIFKKTEEVMDKATFRRSMFKFFNSVLYQIENDAAHRAVAELFYRCLDKLYEDDLRSVNGWWGEIEIEN